MSRVVRLLEHGCFRRDSVPAAALRRLQRLDEGRNAQDGYNETVLDWRFRDVVRAKNYVGVLSVAGLCVEVLPKIDGVALADDFAEAGGGPERKTEELAQQNLLFMLSYGAELLPRFRSTALLHATRASLLEALARAFADSLLDELRRGADRSYVRVEENTSVVRGRILFAEQFRFNTARDERVYVERGELDVDTPLNQLLRLACRVLLSSVRASRTRQVLGEALLHFDGVRDVDARTIASASVALHRGNERFRTVLSFARLVLSQQASAPAAGDELSFSLLFPMERVFEEFVGGFIYAHAAELGVLRSEVHLQAEGARRWLLRDEAGRGRYRLMPDILIGPPEQPRLIIDTKWKRLVQSDDDRRRGGVAAQADIYQLYAYSQRYRCPDNVLLYPAVSGARPQTFAVDGDLGALLRVVQLDVRQPLKEREAALIEELRRLMVGAVDPIAHLSQREETSA